MYSYGYSYNNSAATGVVIGWIIGGLIGCIIFGCITRYINKSKGYEGGFAWGFWLNLIGIIVVACKPDNRAYAQNQQESSDTRTIEESSRNNSQSKIGNNTVELIKQLAELHKNGILTDEEYNTKKADLLKQIGNESSSTNTSKAVIAVNDNSELSASIHSFLDKIADLNTLTEIYDTWQESGLTDDFPNVNDYLISKMDSEKRFGSITPTQLSGIRFDLKTKLTM